MVGVQLSLPFSSCSKLTNDQKSKLFLCQGRRLCIDELELNEILKHCVQQGWLNNGLALAYEYAAAMDHIMLTMKNLVYTQNELEVHMHTRDAIMVNATIISLSAIIGDLLQCVFRWRLLQCFPRPIFIHEGLQAMTLPLFLAMFGRRIVEFFAESTENGQNELWKLVPKPLLVLLLSTSRLFSEFSDMQGFVSVSDQESDFQQLQTVFIIVKEILECEDRVAEMWRTCEERRPGLRFPFPSSSVFSSSHNEWFTTWLTQSTNGTLALGDIVQSSTERVRRDERCMMLRHVLPVNLGMENFLPLLREKALSGSMRAPQSLVSVVRMEPFILQVHRTREIKESLSRPVSAGFNCNDEYASRALSVHSSAPELVPETPSPSESMFSQKQRQRKESPTESNSTTSRSLVFSPTEERRAVEDQMEQMMQYEAEQRGVDRFDNDVKDFMFGRDLEVRARAATKSDERVIRTDSDISHDCITPASTSGRGRFFSEDFSRSVQRHRTRAQTETSMSGLVGHFLGGSPSRYSNGKRKRDKGRTRAQSVDIGPSLLVAAFEKVDERGWNLEWTAAGKIAVWFRLLLPRVKLMRRLFGRQCIAETIDQVIDNTIRSCIARAKRKRELLRQGAAVKIQRTMRHWYYTTRQRQWENAQEQRYKQMIMFLSKWKYVVQTSVRLWRLIRRFVVKKDGGSLTRVPRLRRVVEEYCVLFALKERTDRDNKEQAQKNTHPLSKLQRFRAIERAIGVIQKLVRRYVEKKRIEKARLLNAMSMRICLFFMHCLAVRKLLEKKKIHASATRIQKFLRGVRIRRQVYRIVCAGLRLSTSVRKYLAYRSLKAQLRRVDRPLTIQLHGLRNISQKMINHSSLKIKVAVWWNPLLHIVSQRDALSILQSKRPQFVYESSAFKLHIQDENAVPSTSAESSKIKSELLQNANLKRFTQIHMQTSPSSSGALSSNRPPSPQRQRGRVSVVQAVDAPQRPQSPHRPVFRPQSPQKPRGRPSFVQPLDSAQRRAPRTSISLNNVNNTPSDNVRLPPLPSSGSRRLESGVSLSAINEDQMVRPVPSVSMSSRQSSELGEDDEEEDQEEDENTSSGAISDRKQSKDALPPIEQAPQKQSTQPPRSSFTNQLKNMTCSSVDGQNETSRSYTNVLRGTINFARRLGGNVPVAPPSPAGSSDKLEDTKYSCNFEDLAIKIPGCHGNSIIKFEIIDADRKLGQIVFFLTKESGMMYWGGEYQREVELVHQKRPILMNSQLVARSSSIGASYSGKPTSITLDFRLIAGVALRSKCQWGRLIVRGKGPLKRSLQSQDILSNLAFFDNWRRFYLSLDEFGLFLFDNKFSSKPFFTVSISDFKSIDMDNSAPVRDNNESKNIIEDITSVVLTTTNGDEIFMRFPDAASRMSWHEVLSNVLRHLKKSSCVTREQGWLSKSIHSLSSSFARLSVSPVRFRSPNKKEEKIEEDDEEEIAPLVTPSQLLKRRTMFGAV